MVIAAAAALLTVTMIGYPMQAQTSLRLGQVSDPIPSHARLLVPAFLKWATQNGPLPGQTDTTAHAYSDTKWLLATLRRYEAEAIYVSWNAKPTERNQKVIWEYGLKGETLTVLTDEDRKVLDHRSKRGKLTIAEQAHFFLREGEKDRWTLWFSLGHVEGVFRMKLEKDKFILDGKPVIEIH